MARISPNYWIFDLSSLFSLGAFRHGATPDLKSLEMLMQDKTIVDVISQNPTSRTKREIKHREEFSAAAAADRIPLNSSDRRYERDIPVSESQICNGGDKFEI
ncbi:hypothetical protein CEXT_591341 [Caerostris extrusa]|uniref:Uncharacterized protein n=1 Tax=Caerostris extrusa TaxID=172846 RepID=A0AAV4UAK5_CAEEX|nr:hypothetical protein CEXT_591341 [Caerostris extrusa]